MAAKKETWEEGQDRLAQDYLKARACVVEAVVEGAPLDLLREDLMRTAFDLAEHYISVPDEG
jgi:hypothetical protein